MLTDEEIEQVLLLLLKFSIDTGASGRNLSALFGVSVKTMARWLRAARNVMEARNVRGLAMPTERRLKAGEAPIRMYYSRIDPLRLAIEKMNRANVKAAAGSKPYRKIAQIPETAKKVEALKALMEATV